MKKSFTLIELLVVIAIIGILATLIVANMGTARQKARDAQRKAHLNEIATGLAMAFDESNTYPTTSSTMSVGTAYVLCGSAAGASFKPATTGCSSGETKFVGPFTPPPPTGTTYAYVYTYNLSTGLYTLSVNLERGGTFTCDPSGCR